MSDEYSCCSCCLNRNCFHQVWKSVIICFSLLMSGSLLCLCFIKDFIISVLFTYLNYDTLPVKSEVSLHLILHFFHFLCNVKSRCPSLVRSQHYSTQIARSKYISRFIHQGHWWMQMGEFYGTYLNLLSNSQQGHMASHWVWCAKGFTCSKWSCSSQTLF